VQFAVDRQVEQRQVALAILDRDSLTSLSGPLATEQ